MKEWKDKLNSFNSDKGLLYLNWYQAVRDWKDGKRTAPLPPVEASLDLSSVCPLKCSFCVVQYEKVSTITKDKRIKDIKKGDLLFCYDEKDKKIKETKVKKVFKREVSNYLEIMLENKNKIRVTEEHPFYKNGKWTEAKDLNVNDTILAITSFIYKKGYDYIHYSKIISIKKVNKKNIVYNLECAPYNNFFVNKILVHNCNASRYLDKNYKMRFRMIPNDHLFSLIRFLGKWDVKAICAGGGGSPTTHPKFSEAVILSKEVGMDVAVATNGFLFNDKKIDAMANSCRWVGISVDSATAETYKRIKQVDGFKRVTDNIKALVRKVHQVGTNCDISYKFLINQENQYEIYDACKIAKRLGVKDFHARPMSIIHQGMKVANPFKYDVNEILKQFEKCHSLETKDFHVYTIIHKFNQDFTPKKDFDQCYAAPLCIQICVNGIFFGPDTRENKFYFLGHHYPDPENILKFWGGKKHYDLTFKTGKKHCKSRCTFAPYCRQCQELFIKDTDPMCKNFI